MPHRLSIMSFLCISFFDHFHPFPLFSIISFLQLELLIDKWVPLLCYFFLLLLQLPWCNSVHLVGTVLTMYFWHRRSSRSSKEGGHLNDEMMMQCSCLYAASCQAEFLIIQEVIPKISMRLERGSVWETETEGGCTWGDGEAAESLE